MFKAKANVRLLQITLPPGGATPWDKGQNLMDVKRVGSGLLMQTADNHELTLGDLGAKQGILGGINAVIVGNYLTTLGRPLSACTRIDRLSGSAPR